MLGRLIVVISAIMFAVTIANAESVRRERLSTGEIIIVTAENEFIPERSLTACSSEISCLKKSGWRFHAPVPKSNQASWGNYDRRTTWFYGYWTDGTKYSSSTPHVRTIGQRKLVQGDGVNNQGFYRNGGSPPPVSQVESALCVNCN